MGLAEDFANLGEELMGSFDARLNFLGKNIVDTHKFLHNFRNQHKAMGRKLRHDLGTFVENVHDFVERQQSKFRKDHKAMARKQHTDLTHFVENLEDTVHNQQSKFRKEQKEVHQECKKNHEAWQRVSRAMANKHRNFKTSLKTAKQKAGRGH